MVKLPLGDISLVLTAAMQKRIFHILGWTMKKDKPAPGPDAPGWHIFQLLPLLNSSYSGQFLPTDGITLQEAQQFGKYLYLILAMLGCEKRTAKRLQ
jgi:hypothetical protein